MRQRYAYLILVSVIVAHSVYAQTFNAFNLDHVEWQESGTDSNQPPNYYEWFYKICGDSTLNGVVYKKVYSATINTTYLPPPWTPPSYAFYGFFRQDSTSKSNYLRLPGMSKDSLLCNYSLQLGDTLKRGHYSYMACGYGHIILKTDSLQIGNHKFRILYTDTNTLYGGQYINGIYHAGGFLIEGLGQDYGTMFDWYCPPFEAGVRSLNIYFDTACVNNVGIHYGHQDNVTHLSPLPVQDKLRLRADTPLGEIVLYDLNGKILMRKMSWQTEEQLEMRPWPSGFYFVTVRGYHYKIVKE